VKTQGPSRDIAFPRLFFLCVFTVKTLKKGKKKQCGFYNMTALGAFVAGERR
jgi:hypothetical protein